MHQAFKRAGRIAAISCAALLVVVALWAALDWLTAADNAGHSTAEVTSINDTRNTAIQFLTLCAVLAGFSLTLGSFRASQKASRAAIFSTAVENLGNEASVAVRIGGIHTLHVLAQEDPTFWPHLDRVLGAFVRQRSQSGVGQDVQDALTVLGLRPREWSTGPVLDLRLSKLEGLDLAGVNLTQANFGGADLRSVHFAGAKLKGAIFKDCAMRSCLLTNADMQSASLEGADLQGADFLGTVTKSINVRGANLGGVLNLTEAQRAQMLGTPLGLD